MWIYFIYIGVEVAFLCHVGGGMKYVFVHAQRM